MSDFIYTGRVVNETLSDMYQISERLPFLAEEITNATNKILSARGFKQYVGGVSSDMFSGPVNECYLDTSNLIIGAKQSVADILAYSEDKALIRDFLKTISFKDATALDLSGLLGSNHIGWEVGRSLGSVVSTAGVFALGAAEGLAKIAETGADLVDMGFTTLTSIFTGIGDLINGTDNTRKMWEATKARVAENRTKSIFDSLYQNSPILKRMYDNSLIDGAKVRQVGNGLGRIVGIGAIGFATGGVGMAAAGGLMGFGTGTEEAWSQGGTLEQGLTYGLASGAWEFGKWYVGAGISKLGGGVGTLSKASSLFKSNTGAVLRVGLSSLDGASEGLVRPALTTIYKDYGGENFLDNAHRAFDAAGGWGNVAINAGMAAVAATAGEVFMRKKIAAAKQAEDYKKQAEAKRKQEEAIKNSIETKRVEKAFKSFEEEYPEFAKNAKTGNGDFDIKKIDSKRLIELNEYEKANALYKADALGLTIKDNNSLNDLIFTNGYVDDIKDYLQRSGFAGNIDDMAETVSSKLFASQNLSKIKANDLALSSQFDDIPALLGHDKCNLVTDGINTHLFRSLEEYGTAANTREVAFSLYDHLTKQGYDSEMIADNISKGYSQAIADRGFDHFETEVGGRTFTIYKQKNYRESSAINQVSLDDLLTRIESLPEGVRDTIPDIYLYDSQDPKDVYNTYSNNSQYRQYAQNNSGRFSGAMDANSNRITIYGDATEVDSFIHETGHVIDNIFGITNADEWTNAIESDYKFGSLKHPTDYAAVDAAEDFAESIQLYFTDPNFKINYPNRSNIILRYLIELDGRVADR